MSQILLLNIGYQPISTVSRRKGIDLVKFRNKAEVIESYEDGSPAVIRLTVKTPDPYKWLGRAENARYVKNIVFQRDDFTCVYCGYRSIFKKKLTIDHVLPKSRGGSSAYNNCVTACHSCNNYKDCKTPEEAGMRILYQPKSQKIGINYLKDIPKEWSIFLPLS